jgi:hypothetical protein
MTKIKIDLNRHLCDSCRLSLKCEFEGCELGDENNVIRCKKFQKVNINKFRPRVEKGNYYWHFVYADENNNDKTLIPIMSIDTNSRIDNLLYEIGNYFCTEQECIDKINLI